MHLDSGVSDHARAVGSLDEYLRETRSGARLPLPA